MISDCAFSHAGVDKIASMEAFLEQKLGYQPSTDYTKVTSSPTSAPTVQQKPCCNDNTNCPGWNSHDRSYCCGKRGHCCCHYDGSAGVNSRYGDAAIVRKAGGCRSC